jgi:hypothetical protein
MSARRGPLDPHRSALDGAACDLLRYLAFYLQLCQSGPTAPLAP